MKKTLIYLAVLKNFYEFGLIAKMPFQRLGLIEVVTLIF